MACLLHECTDRRRCSLSDMSIALPVMGMRNHAGLPRLIRRRDSRIHRMRGFTDRCTSFVTRERWQTRAIVVVKNFEEGITKLSRKDKQQQCEDSAYRMIIPTAQRRWSNVNPYSSHSFWNRYYQGEEGGSTDPIKYFPTNPVFSIKLFRNVSSVWEIVGSFLWLLLEYLLNNWWSHAVSLKSDHWDIFPTMR